jgi:1-acyl-sn-glycerol-3-phosphate acyltransferase
MGLLGVSSRSVDIDEFGLDASAIMRAEPFLDFLLDRYWRVQLQGIEGLPRPALFVANRAGLLPYDGLLLSHALARESPGTPRPRFLVSDGVESLPFVNPRLTRLGAVRAGRENALRLLRSGSCVIAFPEGIKGSQKSFSERYRLQSFGRGGVIRIALEAGVPLVPVGIVGGEEVHPLLGRAEGVERKSGLPFVPITPTFPLLGLGGLVPLPVKWVMVFGQPLSLEAQGSEAARDELLVARLLARLRRRIESLIEEGLNARGTVLG